MIAWMLPTRRRMTERSPSWVGSMVYGCVSTRSRLGNGAEGLRHHGQRLRLIELAGDDEVGVIGLVVLLVEDGQVLDGHALDVGAVADDGLAVVVEVVGRGQDALFQDVRSGCFRRLPFRCGPRSSRCRDPS